VRNVVSYRGDNDIKFGGHSGLLTLGATFRLPHFYSTTIHPKKAFDGALGYVFHNKRAGRVIESFSALKGEGEILIPPGTPFKIVGEFHKQPDGSWRDVDGLPLSASPELEKFAKDQKPRKVLLEFEEIV
jgi:hypothetical protein